MKNFVGIKDKLFSVAVVFVILIYIFRSFTVTTNEIGFLGMDKDGREIFVHTLDSYLFIESLLARSLADESIRVYPSDFSKRRVASELEDYSFFERLWQEPMQTKLRIYRVMDDVEYFTFLSMQGYGDIDPDKVLQEALEVPFETVLNNFTDKIVMSHEFIVNSDDLVEVAKEKGVVTFRDLLRGFGFKTYEYYANGELEASIELNPQVTNSIEWNSLFGLHQGGSIENVPLWDE